MSKLFRCTAVLAAALFVYLAVATTASAQTQPSSLEQAVGGIGPVEIKDVSAINSGDCSIIITTC